MAMNMLKIFTESFRIEIVKGAVDSRSAPAHR
jgi:hypothetical protein